MIKTNWSNHLHAMRQREVELAFGFLTGKKMNSGLEIGAGDGYQTSIIAPKFTNFTSTDLNFERIKIKLPGVRYIKLDADDFPQAFPYGDFDVIFSSSVLEHLSDPVGFLVNSGHCLKRDGYVIHIVPTRFMKIAYLLMFYPNLFILILDKTIGLLRGGKIFEGEAVRLENNINTIDKTGHKTSKFKRLFLPSVHGMYQSHVDEFTKWGRKQWEKMFRDAGYNIIREIKGQVCSGYGFGMDRTRKILERLGLCSVMIYILQKNE